MKKIKTTIYLTEDIRQMLDELYAQSIFTDGEKVTYSDLVSQGIMNIYEDALNKEMKRYT